MVTINIFSALSQGRGKLNEENLTAMLGYLLNPKSGHGLGDLYLKRLLMNLSNEDNRDYSTVLDREYTLDITFESPYEYKGKLRRIDIDLKIFSEDVEQLRVLIENKVKVSSADKNQLLEEYQGVCANIEDDGLEDIDVVMVFLTPSITDTKLRVEYETLDKSLLKYNHVKRWIYWDDADNVGTVTHDLKQILIDESMMLINPITEYVRHTIKAFVCFIKDSQMQQIDSIRHKPLEKDSIKSVCTLWVSDAEYRIEEYRSTAIKVFNMMTNEYVIAKPLLRQIIIEYEMPVQLHSESGRKKNTRQLGREVMKYVDLVFDKAAECDPSSVTVIMSNTNEL